jgi:hypothetical protein
MSLWQYCHCLLEVPAAPASSISLLSRGWWVEGMNCPHCFCPPPTFSHCKPRRFVLPALRYGCGVCHQRTWDSFHICHVPSLLSFLTCKMGMVARLASWGEGGTKVSTLVWNLPFPSHCEPHTQPQAERLLAKAECPLLPVLGQAREICRPPSPPQASPFLPCPLATLMRSSLESTHQRIPMQASR